MEFAAFARCDTEEQLYDLLEVKAEAPIAREGKSGRYEVAADKDETKRSTKLIEAVSALLVEKDGHKLQPVASRNGSAADAPQQQRHAACDQRSASAAPGSAPSYAQAS